MEPSTTQRTVLIIVFVVIGAAVIAGAMWYANNVLNSQPVATTATVPPAETAATTTATTTQNQINSNTPSTMDNLKITDVTVGTGAVAQNGENVTVNYTGTFDNGTVFDSSLKPGRTPFSFVLGNDGPGGVIKGWNLGVLGMRVGGKRELVVPPSLGYGASDYGPIPGNSTLHFTVELLSVSTTSQ
jgi:FKBP-type peptidyl-prolyl cis-trans isomerase